MIIKDWKKDFFTIPNMLSLFRLLLIPVYTCIYLNASAPTEYFLAGAILAVSCLTDLIDGQIARRFHMISNVGKVLDPLADKLTQLALTVSLSVKYPAMRCVVILLIVKEIFQTVTMCVMLHRGKALPGALLPGKICTVVLFISLILMVLLPELDIRIVNTIALIDTVFLIYAFVSYFLAYFGKNPKLQDFQQ